MLTFFFFSATSTTEIYTLSLHDALPIWPGQGPPPDASDREAPIFAVRWSQGSGPDQECEARDQRAANSGASQSDRKSTRLNSSHSQISYAVFCLKKKNI